MPKEQSYFIEKLYSAIEQYHPNIVDWDPTGKGFIVMDLPGFTTQILAKKFSIGRLDSFTRKLNKHGFKRSKIDKNKIRFFHKYFNKESKNLNQIKKLTKEESLPKHIKLKMIRQKLNKNSLSYSTLQQDIVNDIFENAKLKQTIKNEPEENKQSEAKDDCISLQSNGQSVEGFFKFQENQKYKTHCHGLESTSNKEKEGQQEENENFQSEANEGIADN